MDLIDEAFQLLREAPASSYALYSVGTAPFLLVLFNFCVEMSYSRDALEKCAPFAAIVAFFYFWMKAFQAFFCRTLVDVYTNRVTSLWNPGTILLILTRQVATQPFGLLLQPLAWLLLLPGPAVSLFFQNISIVGGSGQHDILRSWALARLWPKQSFSLFSFISILAIFTLVNLYALTLAIPYAMKTLLGIESFFTRSLLWASSSAVFIAVSAVAYFLVDIVLKASCVVRCCDADALATGADIGRRISELARQKGFSDVD